MRKLFLIMTILFAAIKLFSQDFAPIGAEWYYDERFAFSGDIDYIKFTSEKDTLIYGEICRKIIKRHKLGCNDRPDTEYLFSRNDTVFFLDTIFKEFQILYIFNAQVSDSWIIKIKDEYHDVDTVLITVDSISTMHINGFDLKALHVTYYKFDESTPTTNISTIIEKIGDIHYMFNWYPWSTRICDGNHTGGLRCYEDSDLGLYSTGIVDSCDYYYDWDGVGVETFELDNKLVLFPNPTNGQIQIVLDLENEVKIELRDELGRLIKAKCFFKTTQLDITKRESGLYFLTIILDNKILGTRKIMKY